MPTEATEDFLAHYGVEGMRWGIRKQESASAHLNITDPTTGKKAMINYDPKKVKVGRNKDGSISVSGNNKRAIANVKKQLTAAKAHPDHKIARETLKKTLASTSNKELKATNERLNLEKQYSQLKYERSTVGKGQTHVKTTLALVGTGLGVGLTVSKLATPDNVKRAKTGLAFIQRAVSNPEAYIRAVKVARLATRR